MPLKRNTDDDAFQLNLTPMIDVVFLLVIFFMTATQFAEVERAVELQLPEVGAEGTSVATAEEPRIVGISSEGVITLDDQPRTAAELTADLNAAREASTSSEGPQVLIHGDARCPFQQVAVALAACREAHISDVGVSVEAAETIRR